MLILRRDHNSFYYSLNWTFVFLHLYFIKNFAGYIPQPLLLYQLMGQPQKLTLFSEEMSVKSQQFIVHWVCSWKLWDTFCWAKSQLCWSPSSHDHTPQSRSCQWTNFTALPLISTETCNWQNLPVCHFRSWKFWGLLGVRASSLSTFPYIWKLQKTQAHSIPKLPCKLIGPDHRILEFLEPAVTYAALWHFQVPSYWQFSRKAPN